MAKDEFIDDIAVEQYNPLFDEIYDIFDDPYGLTS